MGLSKYLKGSYQGRYRSRLRGCEPPVGLIYGRLRAQLIAGVLTRVVIGIIHKRPIRDNPRGSRYQIIKDLDPNSHDNHGI